jgi:hypothetical protein
MSRQPSLNFWRGYLAASIGGAIGAVVLTVLCLFLGFLGYLYVQTKTNVGLEGLVLIVRCSYVGFWIGEVLGCWLALRLGGYANASRTTSFLAGLTFFAALVSFSNMDFTMTSITEFWLPVGLTSISLPFLARFLAR